MKVKSHYRRVDGVPTVVQEYERSDPSPGTQQTPEPKAKKRKWYGWKPGGKHFGQGKPEQRMAIINRLRQSGRLTKLGQEILNRAPTPLKPMPPKK